MVETILKNLNLKSVVAFGRTSGVHHPVLPQIRWTEDQLMDSGVCSSIPCTTLSELYDQLMAYDTHEEMLNDSGQGSSIFHSSVNSVCRQSPPRGRGDGGDSARGVNQSRFVGHPKRKVWGAQQQVFPQLETKVIEPVGVRNASEGCPQLQRRQKRSLACWHQRCQKKTIAGEIVEPAEHNQTTQHARLAHMS